MAVATTAAALELLFTQLAAVVQVISTQGFLVIHLEPLLQEPLQEALQELDTQSQLARGTATKEAQFSLKRFRPTTVYVF